MNTPSKILIFCGYVLGIGATLFLVYVMPGLHETAVGEFLGVLVIFFMYMAGALSLSIGLWEAELRGMAEGKGGRRMKSGSAEAWIHFLNTASREDLLRFLDEETTEMVLRERNTEKWKQDCAKLKKEGLDAN